MKRILASLLSFAAASSFAFAPVQTTPITNLSCPQAVATTDAGFCASFQAVAQCQCVSRGLPSGMCQDMNLLYQRMISMFGGSLQKACEYQHDTSTQNCIDDWNCYRSGGTNSQGGLCSASGRACQ